MSLEIRDVDREIYLNELAGLLPAKLIDVHTHVWQSDASVARAPSGRGAQWPSKVVGTENPIEHLQGAYELLFPNQKVTPVVFGSPASGVVLERTNKYVADIARRHSLPALLVSTPQWSPDQLESAVADGGFLGLKPYLTFAPPGIASGDITILDFLPRAHLEVAQQHGWVVMLHIPRAGRLRDPLNLKQLLEIERDYPNVRLIVAHIGRAYCQEDLGEAFGILSRTERMCLDFSANTNAEVMAACLRAVGARRVLFGSDLPIVLMRMRRVCERGAYVNLVPPGLYGDVSGDRNMREVTHEEGARLTFFIYEELRAFRKAAESVGLARADLEDIFCGNATRVFRL